MSDHASVIDAGAVRFERLLPGPLDRVWDYLTQPDLRATWLAAGPMDPHPGGRVELRFRHADLSPETETVPEKHRRYADGATLTGRVTRWEPPFALAYTWGTDGDEPSEVTFELSPRGDRVLLVLTHRRIARADLVGVASGWHTHLGVLSDRLEGRTPRPFWARHAVHERDYEHRITAA